MDARVGDLPSGDVHVRNGVIVAVGPSLNVPGVEVIDALDRIVLPGFVDTHWHLWSTALRMVIRADDPKEGYFPTTSRVGGHCTPQDAYAMNLGAIALDDPVVVFESRRLYPSKGPVERQVTRVITPGILETVIRRAVLTEKRVHLTFAQVDADGVVRNDAGKPLRDAAHLQDGA